MASYPLLKSEHGQDQDSASQGGLDSVVPLLVELLLASVTKSVLLLLINFKGFKGFEELREQCARPLELSTRTQTQSTSTHGVNRVLRVDLDFRHNKPRRRASIFEVDCSKVNETELGL